MAAKTLPRAGLWSSSALRQNSVAYRSPAVRCVQCRYFNNASPTIGADSLSSDPPIPAIQSSPSSSSVSSRPLPVDTPGRDTGPSPKRVKSAPSSRAHTAQYSLSRAPAAPTPAASSSLVSTTPITNHSASLLQDLAHLALQPPHYITIHIHGKPYLVTAGDTLRLPFLMHGVMPGDILRLDRATTLGSREWTLRAGQSTTTPYSNTQAQMSKPSASSEPTAAEPIIGRTDNLPDLNTPHPNTSSQVRSERPKSDNRPGYIDPELFVCRATVLGTESEPMRIKEKKKRRNRHTKHVRSKHRYTLLRIGEVEVRVPGMGGDE